MNNNTSKKTPMSRQRKTWLRIVIIAFLVAIGVVLLTLAPSPNSNTPTETSEPTASPTAGEELSETQMENLSATTADSVAAIIAASVKEQYADNQTVLDSVQTSQNYLNEDATGNTAKVTIIQFTSVPNDYTYKEDSADFKEYLNGDQVSGDWVVEEASAPESDGVEVLNALRLYDKSDDPSNPAVIEVSYVVETTDNPERNITVLINVAVY